MFAGRLNATMRGVKLALDSRDLFPLLFGKSLSLAESIPVKPGEQIPEYKWIHVATVGLYKGHWQGAFELTNEVFASFVANLRKHPQYQRGTLTLSDGETVTVGCKETIQFDYEHASEMPASEGEIPSRGAPAPAWVCDVETRGSGADEQLWAFAKLGRRIRDQIANNEYRQVSIAFDLKSVDWQTGEPAGPALTSIAFTNHPFLKHLESYAAANRRGGQRLTSDPADAGDQGNDDMNPPASAAQTQTPKSDFAARICRALGIRILADEDAIVEAATDASANGSVLLKLLEALDVKNGGDALKMVPELRAARDKLVAATTELDELLMGQQVMDQEIASSDVGAVMSTQQWDGDQYVKMLTSYRDYLIAEAERELGANVVKQLGAQAKPTVKQRIEARKLGRKKFLEEYGVKTDGSAPTSHLTTTFAAAKGGTQVVPPARVLPAGDATGARVEPGSTGGATLDLRSTAGANPTEKVIAHLSAKDPAFAKLSHYDKCKQASAFLSTNTVQA